MSGFAFSFLVGDSALLRIRDIKRKDGTQANLTGWSLTFTASTVTKTSGAGQIVVVAPGDEVTITIASGDFATAGEFAASLVGVSGSEQETWLGTVVILAVSTAGDLTTLLKVQNYLGTEDDIAADLLAELIRSSSAWMVSRLGQEVLARTVVETRDGDGSTRFLLRQFPVNSVTSVSVDGETIPQQTIVGGDGWILNRDGIDLLGYTFTKGLSNIEIVYSAGCASCPDDLELAVIRHVELQYRDRNRPGIATQTMEGDSASFSNAGTLAYIEGVIDASPLKVWAIA